MLVEKEIIAPGTYWYLDQNTKEPRKFEATPAIVQHFHDTGKAMLSAGLSVPIPLEHQPEAKPQTAAQKAAQQLRDHTGWMHDYKMKGGALFGVLDIQDEEIAKKLPRTIRYTSPYIGSFTDGDGKNWHGVITHLALTSRPRIKRQEPFASIAAAMSLVPQKPLKVEAIDGLALSRAGLLVKSKSGVLLPKFPLAFSLWAGGISLAVEEIKKEVEARKKKPPEKPKEKEYEEGYDEDEEHEEGYDEDEEHEEGYEDTGAIEEIGESIVDADGDIDVCEVICDLLEAVGIQMPEGTDKDNFHERLYKASMDHVKSKMKPEGDMGEPKKDQLPANPVIQEQPPLFMALSQSDVDAFTDPKIKGLAQMAFSLQQNTLAAARNKRQARIAALCQRRPQDTELPKMLAAQDQQIALAMAQEGTVNDPMLPLLDILERGIVDMPKLLTADTDRFTEQPHPKEYSGEMSAERHKEIMAELERNAGVQAVSA